MKLWSDSIKDGERIPSTYAFGKHNPDSHVELTDNKSPHIAWSDLPDGTKSLALLCVDVSVPSAGDDVNQEGRTVPYDLPRVDFFHWVLVDLKPDDSALAEGEFSDGVTATGKDGPAAPRGIRHGLNNYTQWFAGDADMEGQYFGYDGPCPPWNDERIHEYHFRLYALDVDRLGVDGTFDGPAVQQAMQGHIIGEASFVGSYNIFPDAR